jgi:hypothetical protein
MSGGAFAPDARADAMKLHSVDGCVKKLDQVFTANRLLQSWSSLSSKSGRKK